jgi:outer membrane protein assembly factor BamB
MPSPSLGTSLVTSPGATPTIVPGTATPTPLPTPRGPFPGGLLIADRGNGRLLIVDSARRVRWRFPAAFSLPRGQTFSADDAFIAPDGRTIVANEEFANVVVRIDIATRRIVWEYGHFGVAGSAPGYLHTPDDAYPLANGNVVLADIRNCRIIEISPSKRIVRQWGRTGVCVHDPPYTYASPNGDTPLPDGGLLITEIGGSHVVRLDAAGHVVFDVRVPAIYPSDAQLDSHGDVVLADYTNPGAVLAVSPSGRLLWRYAPSWGAGRLDHPSLAVPLANGEVVVNDDFRARVVLIDPRRGRIIWQYGRTDVAGSGTNRLYEPDGLDPLPLGVLPGL